MASKYPLLILDIGNTDTTFAWHNGTTWQVQWRIPSVDSGDLELQFERYVEQKGLNTRNLKAILISSVVPSLTPLWLDISEKHSNLKPIVMGPQIYKYLPIGIASPEEIGTDLVANALAAFHRFQQACVVIDFGTALTFTTLDQTGYIKGVAIAPGLKTAMYALFQKAAQLPEVPLEVPQSALGTNTTTALQAGILLGYEGLVKGLIGKIKEEMGQELNVIATGGLSGVIPALASEFDELDRNLTLEGMRLVVEYVFDKNSDG